MTIETKLFISPSDIVGVQLECGHCSGKVTIPISEKEVRVPGNCPGCLEQWFEGDQQRTTVMTAIDQLGKIARLVVSKKEGGGNRLGLTFEIRGVVPASGSKV